MWCERYARRRHLKYIPPKRHRNALHQSAIQGNAEARWQVAARSDRWHFTEGVCQSIRPATAPVNVNLDHRVPACFSLHPERLCFQTLGDRCWSGPARCGPSRCAAALAEEAACHSITRSTRTMNDSGNVRPVALAVFMFTTSSNLVGCSIGRSPGFAPLKILSA